VLGETLTQSVGLGRICQFNPARKITDFGLIDANFLFSGLLYEHGALLEPLVKCNVLPRGDGSHVLKKRAESVELLHFLSTNSIRSQLKVAPSSSAKTTAKANRSSSKRSDTPWNAMWNGTPPRSSIAACRKAGFRPSFLRFPPPSCC